MSLEISFKQMSCSICTCQKEEKLYLLLLVEASNCGRQIMARFCDVRIFIWQSCGFDNSRCLTDEWRGDHVPRETISVLYENVSIG